MFHSAVLSGGELGEMPLKRLSILYILGRA
jgi:hypothetical protein